MRVHKLASIFDRVGKLRVVGRKPQAPVRLAYGKKLISLLDTHLLEKALRQNDAAGVSDLADLEGLRYNRPKLRM
jgi:hypothetical protein